MALLFFFNFEIHCIFFNKAISINVIFKLYLEKEILFDSFVVMKEKRME